MTYNELAVNLLETSPEAYVPCYASDHSYEDALDKATISLIHTYDTDFEIFQCVYDYEWKYVVTLTITPTKLPLKEKPMSINLDNKVDGTKQSTIIQFFAYEEVNTHLRELTDEFYYMAQYLDRILPTSAEKSVTLRKLLESRDSAVRAATVTTN